MGRPPLAGGRGRDPLLFATLDPDLLRHTHASLEGAYASAPGLGLDFVWGSLPRVDGGFTVPVGARTASVAGWLLGERPSKSVARLCTPLDDVRVHKRQVVTGAACTSVRSA